MDDDRSLSRFITIFRLSAEDMNLGTAQRQSVSNDSIHLGLGHTATLIALEMQMWAFVCRLVYGPPCHNRKVRAIQQHLRQ